MKKIDWYILKKFLVSFFFCLFLFTVVAVAVDSSEKADDFVKNNLTTVQVLKEYYLGFIPWIWNLLFPLFVFIAVIFFTSRMAARSEIIAILASGTSYNRILRPYFIGGIALGLLLWFGSRYWIPKANTIRSNFQANYIDRGDPTKNKREGCERCFYRRIDANTFISIKEFDTVTKSGRPFSLNRIRNDKVVYNLRAESIRWDDSTRKWLLLNAVERYVDSLDESIKLHPKLLYDLKLTPTDLRKDEYVKDKLTTPELKAFIRREEQRGTEGLNPAKVERYRRTATPASVVLLTLIGVIIASRKTRGGSGVHLAMGLLIAATYVLSDRFSTVFATKSNFPPVVAAWLPNIVFVGVAYWLYRQTPK